MLAQEQMVIKWPQINLGWKLEESPDQQSREVLEQFSNRSSSGENQTAVKMVVDNYMKFYMLCLCLEDTGWKAREVPSCSACSATSLSTSLSSPGRDSPKSFLL